MEFFLDTAKVEEVREAVSWGIIRGVTTNPTLMMRAGTSDLKAVTREICDLVQGPVSAEVISADAAGIVQEAQEIATWSPHVVVKVPTTVEGLKALHALQACAPQVRTNATLVFSANQGLMMAQAGATYVSPFVGRIDDAGLDGMEVVRQLVRIFDFYGLEAKILAASLRHPRHVVEAALAGADCATMPLGVLKKAIQSPFTDAGLERFLSDWAQIKGSE